MQIPGNEIHIYSIDSKVVVNEIESFREVLSEFEILKAKRFKFDKDKKNYIVFRSTLRKILSEYLITDPSSITFSYSEKGKPYIKDSILKFNVSHSRSLAVYAVTLNDELGIDTEHIKKMPDAFEIAQRYFSIKENTEFAELKKGEIPLSFFNCWTRKEAFIKALGYGLSYPLADFSVSFKPGDEPQISWIKDNDKKKNEWSLFNIDIAKGYVTSLAVKSKKKNIVIKNLKP
ncbi:MAG: 4'-phosphopantetheinyl transferase superfamily protein [Ignavibacteria bacterium]